LWQHRRFLVNSIPPTASRRQQQAACERRRRIQRAHGSELQLGGAIVAGYQAFFEDPIRCNELYTNAGAPPLNEGREHHPLVTRLQSRWHDLERVMSLPDFHAGTAQAKPRL
jgi:hypothetical protein